MKITMTAVIERQRTRSYIHKKPKNLPNVLYKKPDTFQKARQFPLSFFIQKAIHLTLRDFHEIIELGIIYKYHHTLHCVTFLCTKS